MTNQREIKASELAAMIDHTLLKPEATPEQISKLCQEAEEHGFGTVCVNPVYVRLAADLLRDTSVEVCSVAGFPLGANTPLTKAREATQAAQQGAREIDMVINVGALKAGNHDLARADIAGVVQACHGTGAICKVIIEAGLLTREEKVTACELAKEAGADYVKTSTGFIAGGATLEDVALMRETVGEETGVKASGGIRTYEQARDMILAGASRIGTSSGVQIIEGAPE